MTTNQESGTRPDLSSPSVRAIYSRLLGYVRPYWKAFVVAALCMVFTAATESTFPAVMNFLLDKGFKAPSPEMVWMIPLGLVGLFFVRGIAVFCSGYVMSWITSNVVMTLRREMFAKLLRLPTRYYADNSPGALISKVVFDTNNISDASSNGIITMIRESLTLVGLLGYLLWLDWKLTLIALSVGPLVITTVQRFGKRLRDASQRGYESMGQITHILEEATGAHKVVKIFGGQSYEKKRFMEATARYRRAQMREAIPASVTVPITHLASAISVAIIIFIALYDVSHNGKTSVGSFVGFITGLLMLLAPAKRLTEVNNTITRGVAAAESIFKLLDLAPEADEGKKELGRAHGDVRFEDVQFSYPDSERIALAGIDIDVKAGETIALVGASGSGKSTLVSLLPRFYSPQSGRILIDGVDIAELSLASLRENISLVSQDVVLFNDSVAANIAYGSADIHGEEDIIAAARAANAWGFIEAMPEGLATPVGSNGVKISGGQRQRLAIARALLKNAPILILDEATSALDTESERLVQAALSVLMQGRTTFVIAHRLSTIESADRILVMDRGRVVEAGRHAELLALGGRYAHLHQLQFQSEAAPE
ncbi:lipid A export permease/ATP-binding protein MsbA [Niveibacterium terrae]|uniref:lipid A export permease/ATP-binding protein MsbA n=1 Tax=Niveibacterium terrae TaxID=3373598 RepID=UPI003A9573F2